MQIRDVVTYHLKRGSAFVVVRTDEGIDGIGECSPMHSPVLTHFVEHALKPILVGEDPLDIDRLWRKMFFRTYKLGVMGVQPEAIAGIDIALWDIRGKATNQTVWKLLGGRYRDRVSMYASIGGGAHMQPDDMVRAVASFQERGFRAFKIRMDWRADNQDIDPAKDYAMFAAVRKHLGDDVPLSFDANNGYSVSTAIAQGRRFEQLGIFHYEEPIPQYDYAGYAQLCAALDVPVSAGEHEYTRWQFRDLILQAQVDILQPDVVKCAGISEMMKIAVLAETFDKHFVPHQTQPTIGTAANLHCIAAIQHASRPQEFTGQNATLDSLFREPLRFEDGALVVPTGPGLGLELDEEACRRQLV
ncbi:mandelate racemase/muconate lactonizing enzyme family protein [Candidatus Poribacteria bacterium]|nr:mandelate racemase/muconate lactonizing enzyme family protein [Candidatus Poribacteria bacterium]